MLTTISVKCLVVLSLSLSLVGRISPVQITVAHGPTQQTHIITSVESSSLVHTTVADFGNCGPINGTRVTNMAGGEIRLAAVLEDYFDSSTINYTRWITGQLYDYGGAFPPTVTSGILSLNASFISSTIPMTQPMRIFESRTRFRVPSPNTSYGDIGFGRQPSPGCTPQRCPPGANRLFITDNANQVFANARNGSNPVSNTLMTDIDPAVWHTYRIEWGQTSTNYYVDGTLAATNTLPSTYTPYVWLYTLNPGSTIQVDWVRVDSYPSTGIFTSCSVDAGAVADWESLATTAQIPAGTALQFETRTSLDGVAWSEWSASISGSGGPIISPHGRYLQYRVTMTTSDPTISPQVDDILFTFTPLRFIYLPFITKNSNTP